MKIKKAEKQVNYFEIAKELYLVNQQRLALEKKEKDLKSQITKIMEKQPKDNKHNAYLAFTSADGSNAYVKYEARQSVSINEEKAREFFEKEKLTDVVFKERTVEYMDEEEISQLVQDGRVTFEELESISEKKVSYALKFVKEKEVEE